jgi:hypothetical protein
MAELDDRLSLGKACRSGHHQADRQTDKFDFHQKSSSGSVEKTADASLNDDFPAMIALMGAWT